MGPTKSRWSLNLVIVGAIAASLYLFYQINFLELWSMLGVIILLKNKFLEAHSINRGGLVICKKVNICSSIHNFIDEYQPLYSIIWKTFPYMATLALNLAVYIKCFNWRLVSCFLKTETLSSELNKINLLSSENIMLFIWSFKKQRKFDVLLILVKVKMFFLDKKF